MANMSALIPAALRQLLFAAAVVAAALSGSPPAAAQDSTASSAAQDSTASGPVPNIGGHWITRINLSIPETQVSCQESGELDISPQNDGSSFSGYATGTRTCTKQGVSLTRSDPGGVIWGGQISGNQVAFPAANGCWYHGTISGNPPNRMSGTVTCPVLLPGTTYQINGTWQAGRPRPRRRARPH